MSWETKFIIGIAFFAASAVTAIIRRAMLEEEYKVCHSQMEHSTASDTLRIVQINHRCRDVLP